jgi:hypothetical protein
LIFDSWFLILDVPFAILIIVFVLFLLLVPFFRRILVGVDVSGQTYKGYCPSHPHPPV